MRLSKPILGLTLACLATPALAGPDIDFGLWETTVTTQMSGMPMSIPPVTTRSCIRESDLVPQTDTPGQECELLEHSVSGNQVTWRIRCSSQGATTTGQGQITYSGDTYEGEMEMNTAQGGHRMAITQQLEGRRVGECQP